MAINKRAIPKPSNFSRGTINHPQEHEKSCATMFTDRSSCNNSGGTCIWCHTHYLTPYLSADTRRSRSGDPICFGPEEYNDMCTDNRLPFPGGDCNNSCAENQHCCPSFSDNNATCYNLYFDSFLLPMPPGGVHSDTSVCYACWNQGCDLCDCLCTKAAVYPEYCYNSSDWIYCPEAMYEVQVQCDECTEFYNCGDNAISPSTQNLGRPEAPYVPLGNGRIPTTKT